MAAQGDRVSRATDGAAIALLRRLRAGAEIPYVHRADVCSAAPADLVANLMPAPGSTDQTTTEMEDGGSSNSNSGIWYFYCPKRYKNGQGKASGHRHRAIDTPGETSWHSEIAAKAVHGPGGGGGTFCTFSYGRRKDGSLERMGWSMVEYDFVDDQAANAAASGYVLCKVYRPSRAKGKKPSSSSSKTKTARGSSKKRKASSSNLEEAQARPAKLIHIQREQVQVQLQHDNSEFVQTEYGPMPSQLAHINVDEWIDRQDMFGAAELEDEQGLQQPCAEPEQGGEFIQMSCGVVVPVVAEATLEDLLGSDMMSGGECIGGAPTASAPVDDGFFVGVDPVVVPELTVEGLLGTEMMSSGEGISMPTTASTPPDDDFFVGVFGAQEDARSRASSSHAPSSSTGCSILVQEPPLWLPHLMCS